MLGLTTEEVSKSREENGSNKLTEKERETILQKAINNLKDPIIGLLCIMCTISFVLAYFGYVHIATPIGILIAILLATFVRVFSEAKSDSIFETLKGSEITKVKVYRDNYLTEIDRDDVVVGDYIVLQAGDEIPADGYIISGKIKVNQSTLNGESEEVLKIPIPHREDNIKNSIDLSVPCNVYRGTVVTDNEATMIATKVGDKTIYGGIGLVVQDDNGIETPLKARLTTLANQIKLMGWAGAILIALVIIVKGLINNEPILALIINAITMALSIVVMAVPEGLPLLISLVCTLNMRKMYNENILVRVTNDIETAGSMNILFSDKTGTITKNKLEVVDTIGYNQTDNTSLNQQNRFIWLNMKYNNSAKYTPDGIIGSNDTDRCLLAHIKGNDIKLEEYETIDTIKFNSTNKYSACTIASVTDEPVTLIKGAPEKIMKMCGIEDFDISTYTKRAMRVLGFCHTKGTIINNRLPETELEFDGVVCIRDEIRPDAQQAIQDLQKAGIQVVMITGDCKETANAIAKDSGLLGEDSISITSDELNALTDEEVKEQLPKLAVVSRALPLDKQRLVKISQEMNLVTGMVGDGGLRPVLW